MRRNIASFSSFLVAVVAVAALIACSGSSGMNQETQAQNSVPHFTPIADFTLNALGQKLSPVVDLTLYVQGGTSPYSFAITNQTSAQTISVSLNNSQLVSDYAYGAGTNTVTLLVTDSKQQTAQTTVNVVVNPPKVAYQLYGVDFSPYIAGQNPNLNTPIGDDQLIQQIGALAPYVKAIRIYGCVDGVGNAAKIAKRFGLKVYLGAWISTDSQANNVELQSCISVAQATQIDAAIIGSEALLRGDVSADQLISYLNQFRAAVPGVPVATADTYSVLENNPKAVAACDFLFANYFPFWESIDISKAVASLHAEDALLRATYPSKAVIVSETGWKSFGDAVGAAAPSVQNAAFYFLNFESWAQAEQRKSFYFEAHDEPWKTNDDGWGIWDQNLVLKQGMSDVFDGKTMPDNWTCNAIPGGAGTPSLQFTLVPPIGSPALLKGQEWHVVPADYRVVVYIHVGINGWWVKPYSNAPLTTINCDGSWNTNIDTGGNDASADQIAGFLIPSTYSPPILLGAATLPAELYSNSVANLSVARQ